MILKNKKSHYYLFLILMLGFVLRLISINQSFWLDETTSAVVARDMSFGSILSFVKADFHPPLYYMVLKIWGNVFSFNEVALRMFSVLSALVSIFLIYKIVCQMYSAKAGYLAALLMAINPLHIYYSQEARMYMMEATLVLILIYAYLNLTKNKRCAIIYTFSAVFLAATDYLPCLIFPAIFLYSYLSNKDKGWWKHFLILHIPLVIFLGFWLPTLVEQIRYGISIENVIPNWWMVLGVANIKNFLLIPVKFLLGRISFENNVLYAGVVISIFGLSFFSIIQAILKDHKKYLNENRFILLWLFVPLVLSVILSFKLAVISYFRFLFLLPAFIALVALGLTTLRKSGKWIIFGVISLNVLFSLSYLVIGKFHREDWRRMFEFVQKTSSRKSSFSSSLMLYPTIYQQETARYYDPQNKLNWGTLESIKSFYDTIYLVRYAKDIIDPMDTARKQIESIGYNKLRELDFNGVVLWEYRK